MVLMSCDGSAGFCLVVEDVADHAGAWVLRQRGRADAVGVGGGGDAQQVGAGRSLGRVGDVVADLIDRAIAGRLCGGKVAPGRGPRQVGLWGTRACRRALPEW